MTVVCVVLDQEALGGTRDQENLLLVLEQVGLAQSLWPGNRRFQRGITAASLWVPSYPQDYARRNQVLRERIAACLGGAGPRFGQDPIRRMKAAPEAEGLPVDLWHYPVRILAWEMYVDPMPEAVVD